MSIENKCQVSQIEKKQSKFSYVLSNCKLVYIIDVPMVVNAMMVLEISSPVTVLKDGRDSPVLKILMNVRYSVLISSLVTVMKDE